MTGKKTIRKHMQELVSELEDRDPSEDPIVLARRINNTRMERLQELSEEITSLEGMEQSGKYSDEIVERAAKIVAAEHQSIVQDIQIEMEALKKAMTTE